MCHVFLIEVSVLKFIFCKRIGLLLGLFIVLPASAQDISFGGPVYLECSSSANLEPQWMLTLNENEGEISQLKEKTGENIVSDAHFGPTRIDWITDETSSKTNGKVRIKSILNRHTGVLTKKQVRGSGRGVYWTGGCAIVEAPPKRMF